MAATLDNDNFAHMSEYDAEDPAQAAADYEAYLAGRKPIVALLERLKVSTHELRTKVRFNWAGQKLNDRDCETLAGLFKGNTQFTVNPSLANLGLDNNLIGDAGLSAIAEVLKISNSMFKHTTHIWLNGNRFGDEGVTALAEALAAGALPKPQKLYLNDNQIADEGAFALAKTIQFCHEELARFRFLYLGNNNISEAGKAAINSAVAKRNRIEVIYDNQRPGSPGPM